jgi:murein L,D-transpeptidase YafK
MLRLLIVISTIVVVPPLTSCTPQPQPRLAQEIPPPSTATPQPRADVESVLPWASEEPSVVVVNKACQTLNVYQYGHLTHTYPIVYGRKPGRKLYQGDRRTPLGLYEIITKDFHPRWSRFMLLDYPNEEDRRRYQGALANGDFSKKRGNDPGPGGAIGIHGSDRESFNRAGINWTLGCISMLSKDVKEFDKLVSVGTFVYIHD